MIQCCKNLTYIGTYLLKHTTFRPIIYKSWSFTNITCVGSGIAYHNDVATIERAQVPNFKYTFSAQDH